MVDQVLRCQRAVTADTAIALERALGADARLWLNLQTSYDLQLARQRLAASAAG